MLLRNSLWNLAGAALPALVALGTVPVMIHGLGIEGFGVVTLISSVIGYFGVLDVNLSAGSIKYLSEHHARQDTRRFAETFWFGIAFYALLGLIAGVLLFVFSETLLDRFLTLSAELHDDALRGWQIAALGFGLLQLQNYLLVVPQSLQRYASSARGEAFFGIAVNLLSAIVAMQGGGISGVLMSRVAVSFVNLLWLVWLIRQLGVPLSPAMPSREICLALARFSGHSWLSRVASMLHQHADKLIVGALAGPIALAMYTVPGQLASRILGLTFRLSSVIYPRVSALAAKGDQARLRVLYLDSTRILTYLNMAVLGMIAMTGELFLAKWVGPEFVAQGYPVLLLITAGLLADSLTVIPSLVNDGLGHPKITGRFAIARGALGVAMVWAGTTYGGIIGAAAAHLLSSLMMTVLFLGYVHGRTIPLSVREPLRVCWGPSLAVGMLVLILMLPLKWVLPETLSALLLLAAISGIAWLAAGLAFVIRVDERAALFSITRRWIPGTQR